MSTWWVPGLGLVGLAAAVTAQYFAAKAATGFAADVRHALFARLTALSFPDVDQMGVSAMMTRMTSDVNQAQTGVNMALRLLLRMRRRSRRTTSRSTTTAFASAT